MPGGTPTHSLCNIKECDDDINMFEAFVVLNEYNPQAWGTSSTVAQMYNRVEEPSLLHSPTTHPNRDVMDSFPADLQGIGFG